MAKKSINNRYNSKLIIEELEARQLFSDGAAAVVTPPQNTDSAATVINVDANFEPVVDSQNSGDVPAITHDDTAVELANPEGNTSPVSAITTDSTVNNPDEITVETIGNTSQLLTEKETQAYVSSQDNQVNELASIEINTNENTEILLETDCPTAIENLSEENDSGQLANLSVTDDTDSASQVLEQPLTCGLTDSIDGDGTLVNQVVLNDPALTSETTPPEIEVCSSLDPSLIETKNEIIFVDSRVDDYQSLIDDITSNSKSGANFEVILLDGNKDGIAQITDTLSHYQNLDSVHLISHGSDGSIDLGSNQLNFQTLTQNQEQIKSWGDAFAANGDFLIYGCNVAETQFGQSFIDYLSNLTKTDVAASNDATGFSGIGADWNLEYQTGSIESQVAISINEQAQWTEVLAVTSNGTVTSAANINTTSLTWAHTVNAGVNRALFVEISIDNLGANVNSVTYGGVAMTQVGRQGGNHAVEIWTLVNPTVGTANVVVSLSGNTAVAAGASTFNGVNQATPTGAFVGNSGTTFLLNLSGSVTVASAPGDVVIDAQFWTDTLANPVGAGQTSQWSSSSLLSSALGSSSTESGAANVTMSGSASLLSALGAHWSIGAVSVKAAPTPNIAPVNTVPSAQTTNEDTVKVFSSANGNQISITDADAAGGSNEITLTVTNGTLTLAGTTGLTFTSGDGTTDSTMTFRGTASAINTALNGLSYSSTANYNGSATLTLSTLDSTLVSLNIDTNLQARYTFENNANDVAAGIVQNGTLVGNATFVNDGTRGQVLTLDGSGGSVQINSTFGQPQNFTIGGWVNLYSGTGRKEFISIDDRVHIALDDVGGVKGSVQVGAGSWVDLSSNQFIAGTGWHHVMYVFNGTSDVHTLYIDGVQVASAANTNTVYYSGATTTYIGQHPTNAAWNLNGKVDDVRIYDRALSGSEVTYLASDLSLQDVDTVAITVTPVNDAPTFSSGTGNVTTPISSGDDWARAMTLQSDGKMVLVGYSSNGSNDDFAVVRYNADGSLDTSFGTGGKVTISVGSSSDQAYAVTTQTDGKIVVSGTSYNGSNLDFAVIRLNTGGSLDTSFSGDGKVMVDFASGTDEAQSVVVQPDGKIIVGGYTNASLFALTRLNSDGTLDTSFGTAGKATTDVTAALDSGYSLTLQSDGKILFAGAGNNNFAVVRYSSDGTLDSSFGTGGKVETDLAGGTDYGRSVVVNSDGTILVSGYSSFGDFLLVKYTSTGTLDTSFGGGTGKVTTDISGADNALDLAVQADGKIILGGYNGSFNTTLVRYNVNGSLDTSFGSNGKVTTTISSGSFIEGLAVRPDGRIVAGVTATVGGNRDFGIISYLPDGSIDPIFNTSSITNTLDATSTYIENGSAVILDSNVKIFDSELSLSNFNGATLTLARNGGANPDDALAFDGLTVTVSGANVYVSSTLVGTYAYSGGEMSITFNTNATQSRINTLMQKIVYWNWSDAPPASVQINWTFSDGNTGSQGTGGALTATGSTVVNITAVNDAPIDLYSINGVSESNLIGIYGFNNPANLGRDDAGNNAPITFYGTPGQTTGPSGSGALDLAGGASGQYGDILGITTGGAMTFAASVRFDSTGGWERVFDFGQANSGGIGNIYVAREFNTNNLTFTIEKNGGTITTYRATASGVVTNGSWLHFAATVDASGNMALYINGSLAATQVGVAPDIGVRDNNFIGKSHWNPDAGFDGAIDNFVVANGAMNANQISALYQQTTGFTVAENSVNGTVVGTVVGFDVDASANPTFSLTDSAGGRFAINSTNGTITVANGSLLDYESATSHSITVQVTDSVGATYTQTFTVSLSNVVEAPSAINLNASESYTEDTSVNLTDIVITRGDSATVTATLTLSNPAAGGLNTATSSLVTSTYNAGTGVWTASGAIANVNALLAGLTFTPATNFNGNFTIATSVSDGAPSVNGIKAVTGTAVNDTPVFSGLDNTPAFNENGLAVVLDNNVTITDSELSSIDSFSGTSLVLRRNGGDNSQDVFSASGTLSVLTQGGNLVVGGITVGNVITNSGGLLVLSFNGNATNALVNSVLQQIAYSNTSDTPPTSVQINWSFNDVNGGAQGTGGMGIGTGSTTVNITAVNDAPSATNLSAAEAYTEDTALNLTNIVISDVDSATVTATLTLSNAAAGSLNTATSGLVTSTYNAGTGVWSASGAIADVNTLLAGLTFTPTANFNGDFTIATSVSDDVAAPITGIKTMTGTAVNDASVLTSSTGTLPYPENTVPYLIGSTGTISDIDSTDFNGGQLTITLTANGLAEDRLTIRNQGTGAGQVGVSGVNITYAGVIVGTFNGPVTGGTALVVTFNASSTPSIAQKVLNNLTYENTSEDPSTAVRTITASITDGDGGTSNTVTSFIAPSKVNDAPVNTIIGDGAVFPEESVIQLVGSLSIADIDAGSGSYTVTLTVTPGAGTLTSASGSGVSVTGSGTNALVLTGTLASINNYLSLAATSPVFSATEDFNGAVSFTLFTSDNGNSGSGGALTDSDTINGSISAVTDIADDNVTTNEDTSVTFSPLSNDTFENSGRTISHINGASITSGETVAVTGGNLTLNADRTLTFAPTNNYVGTPSFTYTVTSGGVTETATVSLTVTQVNDAPTTSAVTLNSIAEDSGARLITQAELLANATDVEGNALTASGLSITSGSGSLVNNGNGTWTYTPASNDDTAVSFSYTITDGNGGSVAGSASLDITPVNDAPVITSNGGGATETDSVAENQTAVTTVTVTDNDLPAQTISYSIVGGADAALFTINASTGALQFISGRNYESPTDADTNNVYEVIVQASDGAGGTDTQAISVSVTPVNEAAPVITSNSGGSTAAISIAENTSSVTTVTATDNDLPAPNLTYSISGGVDAAKFSINSSTGELSFIVALNYENADDSGANNVYDVTVMVSDGSFTDTQDISVTVNNLDEAAPTLTSGGVATAINENSGTGQVIYTATSTDAGDTATGSTGYSLGGTDAGLFSIDSSTGEVTLLANPNYEAKASYSFSVIATDAAGNASAQAVTLAVNNLDEARTGEVIIFGNMFPGQTLSVINTLNDPDGLGDINYTWKVDGITVALGTNYTLTQNDVGKMITVIASYTDGHGSIENIASTSMPVTNNLNPLTPPNDETVKPLSPIKDTTHVISPLNPEIHSKNFFNDTTNIPTDIRNNHKKNETVVITDLNSHIEKLLINSNSSNLSDKRYSEYENGGKGHNRDYSSQAILIKRIPNIGLQQTNDAAEIAFLNEIDHFRQRIDLVEFNDNSKQVDVQIMLGTTVAFTAGFVSWILRGGALLSSLLSTVPLITRYDPIPILRSSKKGIPVAEKDSAEPDDDEQIVPTADETTEILKK
jgi:uncharacterized delta-60 repeat protein